jgi:hypothetical protein
VTTTTRGHYRDYTVVGTADQLRNVVTNHATAGTLAAITTPRPISATDPRLRMTLRIHTTSPVPTRPTTPAHRGTTRPTSTPRPTTPPTPTRSRPIRRPMSTWRRWLTLIGLLFTAALTAALVYLIWQLVAFVTANAAAIIGFVTIAALAYIAINAGGGKRHCPGC